jgi:hypothetical protein
MILISQKTIALLISISAFFIVNALMGAMPIPANGLSIDSQLITGLGSKDISKSINEVTQIAITKNQSTDDPSNTTATKINSNSVVQFGSNQDPIHSTPDYATISKSDLKAQFGSNQDPIHSTPDYATISKSDLKAQFGSNQN